LFVVIDALGAGRASGLGRADGVAGNFVASAAAGLCRRTIQAKPV
jgi:hypothetical protein